MMSEGEGRPVPSGLLRDSSGRRWRVADEFRSFLIETVLRPLEMPGETSGLGGGPTSGASRSGCAPVSKEKVLSACAAIRGAELVKESMVRRVERLPWGGRPIIFKTYRIRSLRDQAKYLVKRSRAAAEWHAGRLLLARGIATARPLAYGEWRRGPLLREAYYFCTAIEDATALGPWLEERFRPGDGRAPEKIEVVRLALRQLARLHAAGSRHADFHGGNILVGRDPTGARQTYLIDLHSLGRLFVPGEAGAVRDLTDFLFSLRYVLDAGEMRRAADAYRELRGWPQDGEVRFWRRLQHSMVHREERHYRSRARRCVKESTVYTSMRLAPGAPSTGEGHLPAGCLWKRRDVKLETLCRAIERHREALVCGGAGIVALAGRTRVTRVRVAPADGLPRALVVKEFLDESVLPWRRRALRSWRGAHHLIARGLPTPRPLACLAGRDRRGFLITEDAYPAAPLDIFLYRVAREGDPERPLGELMRVLAEAVGTLWKKHLIHRDLSAKNILIAAGEAGPMVLLVDTGDVRVVRRVGKRDLARALVQLGDLPRFVGVEVHRRFVVRLARVSGLEDLSGSVDGRRGLDELLARVRREIARRVTRAGTSVRGP